jgi:uncharacterized SAM-binding protein YcdF (DUF218 family)
LKKRIFLIVLAFGLLISVILLMLFSGEFLEKRIISDTRPSQLIFMHVGVLKDRVLAVNDLWTTNSATNIVYGKTKDTDFKFLDSLGVDICRDTDKIKYAFIAFGIPEQQIKPLEAQTRSTIDEANLLRDYLKQHQEINNITIVTSSYHSRRSYLIVKDRLEELDRDITIHVYPSPYTTTNLNQWWRKKEDAVVVCTEYLKLLSFYVWERWQ